MAITIQSKGGKLTLSVTAGATQETLVTHVARLIQLVKDGFEFEAAMAMAAKALASYYLSVLVDTGALNARTLRMAKKPLLTFGGVQRCLADAGALNDPRLKPLSKFVADRNHMMHNLVLSLKPFDFRRFFDRGNRLAMAITGATAQAMLKALST